MQQLFVFIKMLNNYWHHWSDSSAWIMAKCIHKIVFTNTQMVVQKLRFISIFVDEDTTMDSQSWLGVYLVDGWKHNPILLTLEQLINSGTIDNLTKVIMDNVLQYGGL
jgi:hypothetical protein